MTVCSRARALVAAAMLVAPAFIAPAGAAEDWISVGGSAELQFDSTVAADFRGVKLNDLFTKTEPEITLRASERWHLVSQITLERVRQDRDSDDRYFGDHGVYAKTLYLEYDSDRLSLQAGKVAPPFGLAWEEAPSLYGRQFAEDYEVNERIGFVGGLKLVDASTNRKHRLALAAFSHDTTELSRSVIKNRGRRRQAAGGPSNTGDLSSFTAAFDGERWPGAPSLHYHLALRHLAAGATEVEDERGIALGLQADITTLPDLTVRPLVEYVHLTKADGLARDRDYWTLGAEARHGAYLASLSATWRTTDPDGGTASTDLLWQTSLGRFIAPDIRVELGYRFRDESGLDSHTVGLRLKIDFAYGTD
ncbi:MAG: hypothetical protein EXQ85_04585 [Alphaproteobacteria bacterium]|nr:hypothetical protein [Alphaproteobacteria bacterium]